jgi:hypothetical protein
VPEENQIPTSILIKNEKSGGAKTFIPVILLK